MAKQTCYPSNIDSCTLDPIACFKIKISDVLFSPNVLKDFQNELQSPIKRLEHMLS